MKTTHAATLVLILATLGSTHAFAADASAGSVTRAQVLAELTEAQRTGDIVDGRTGKKLNEQFPTMYPAKAATQGPSREQVLAEFAEAKRTGDIVVGNDGKKLKDLWPGEYPTHS